MLGVFRKHSKTDGFKEMLLLTFNFIYVFLANKLSHNLFNKIYLEKFFFLFLSFCEMFENLWGAKASLNYLTFLPSQATLAYIASSRLSIQIKLYSFDV